MRILIRNHGMKQWKPIEPIRGPEIDLQKLLVESPELLSFEEEDVSFIVAIPGFKLDQKEADILAFSKDGDIAIVECKRADNPEIKRKVIGQILEYAAYLWKRSYEEIDEQIESRYGKDLLNLVREKVEEEDWDKDNFLKGVKESLENGEFFLIIAVDEVNEELEHIIRYLNECGSSAYSIYALEMKRFRHENTEILIPDLYPESIPEKSKRKREHHEWNWDKFYQTVKEKLKPEVVEIIKEFRDLAEKEKLPYDFGHGKTGSMQFYIPGTSGSVFSITEGKLRINYDWLLQPHGPVDEKTLKEFHKLHGLNVPDDFSKMPSVELSSFVGKPEMLEKFKRAVIWLKEKISPQSTEIVDE